MGLMITTQWSGPSEGGGRTRPRCSFPSRPCCPPSSSSRLAFRGPSFPTRAASLLPSFLLARMSQPSAAAPPPPSLVDALDRSLTLGGPEADGLDEDLQSQQQPPFGSSTDLLASLDPYDGDVGAWVNDLLDGPGEEVRSDASSLERACIAKLIRWNLASRSRCLSVSVPMHAHVSSVGCALAAAAGTPLPPPLSSTSRRSTDASAPSSPGSRPSLKTRLPSLSRRSTISPGPSPA